MTKTEAIIRKAMREGKDPFTEVAAELYSTPALQVTKIQRQMAKASAYQFLATDLCMGELKEVFHRG
jgi:hypothetical protein